jgi:hypothetical protein
MTLRYKRSQAADDKRKIFNFLVILASATLPPIRPAIVSILSLRLASHTPPRPHHTPASFINVTRFIN